MKEQMKVNLIMTIPKNMLINLFDLVDQQYNLEDLLRLEIYKIRPISLGINICVAILSLLFIHTCQILHALYVYITAKHFW